MTQTFSYYDSVKKFTEWYRKTKRGNYVHRDDGPARIHDDGTLEWAFDDIFFTFEDWCFQSGKTDEEIVQLKLQYGVSDDC